MRPVALTDSPDDESGALTQMRSPSDELALDATLAELARFVQSPTRLRILDQLQRSPCSTTELHEALDVHRTTIQRNLTILREKHCIRSSPTETVYHLTPPGQLFLETFQQLLPTARMAHRLGMFCAQFPGTVPVDVACLRECGITTTAPATPHAPQERVRALLTASETVRLSVPCVSPRHLRTMAAHFADWSPFELITPTVGIERLTATHPALTEPVIATGSVCVLTEPASPAVGVGLLDETAVIIVYDDTQRMHALLEATRPSSAISDWVRDQYEDRQRTATVIE